MNEELGQSQFHTVSLYNSYMPVVDQFSDPVMAHLVRRVTNRPKLAAAVSEIDVDRNEANALPDSAFAWPEKRAFPVHSREHTMLSRVYREDATGVPAYVDKALKEACDVYGIDEGLYTRDKVASAPLSPEAYLLPDLRRLRVTEKGHVKEAEDKLRNEGSKLTIEHQALASRRLVEKAAFYGTGVSVDTYKTAGMTVTDKGPLVDWLEARREAAPELHKDGYQKLANAAKKMPAESRDRAEQIKLAEAIGDLDAMSGLDRYYNRKLPNPLMTVFNSAKIAGAGVNLAGKFVPVEHLAALGPAFFSDVLGPDIVREASDMSGQMDPHKLAQVIDTLPADMKRVLAQNMR
jgi:hypothetical protein